MEDILLEELIIMQSRKIQFKKTCPKKAAKFVQTKIVLCVQRVENFYLKRFVEYVLYHKLGHKIIFQDY